MSYIINKSNGSKLVVIQDGSINVNVCNLTLVGKNYAGYGESIATNFVKLLENFSNTTQPTKPVTGQIWYDSGNKKIKFFNGVEFKSVPSLQISRSFPSDQHSGDLHFNETSSKLYYYNGTEYIPIGPPTTGKAASNTITPILLEDGVSGNPRYVLGHQLQDPDEVETTIVAITSDFTITPTLDRYSAPGEFTKIRKGITLRGADPTTGISSETGAANEYVFWGTASDSLRLNGKLPSDYVTYAVPIFENQVQVRHPDGVNINTNQLRLFTNSNGAKITTELPKISIDATVGFVLKNIINIDATNEPTPAILPSTTPDTLVDIGSTISPFRNIYVSEAALSSITKTGTSGTGDIGQPDNRFDTVYATSTTAAFADLAEKYLADAVYEPGTVLRLGGTAEVTICATYESEEIAGIVSTNPAYLMNDALENGVAIALKGRVPCKVKGSIKKGDILVSSSTPGHAEVRKYGHRTNPLAVLGKALQDFDGDTGVIEIMVY